MTDTQATELLHKHLKTNILRQHCLAVATIAQVLAKRLGQDEPSAWVAGLLHDIDLDITGDDFARHGLAAMELLAGAGLSEEILHAIRAHAQKEPLVTDLDKILWVADPLSGLIAAAALMRPERTITALPLKSLKKRFKDKRFAAGVNRQQLQDCTLLGLELDEFLQLGIDALKPIESELGF